MAVVLVVAGIIRLLNVFQFTSAQPDDFSIVSSQGPINETEALVNTQEEEALETVAEVEPPVPTAEPPEGSPDYVYKYPEMYVENTTYTEPNPDEKLVYLTFDDGPCSTTSQLLDKLDELDVKATFFVTGLYGTREEVIDRIAEIHSRGHYVAVHTYSHVYKDIYASVDAIVSIVLCKLVTVSCISASYDLHYPMT